MFIYYHTCLDCGTFSVETKSIAEYVAIALEHGRTETDDAQMPCPSCEKLAPRDWTAGKTPYVKVQGGDLYKTRGYHDGAVKDWYRSEIQNTKNVIDGKVGSIGKRPYTGMTLNKPEDVGFKQGNEASAKSRAQAAKKMAAKTQDAINDARKNS